MSFKDLFDEKLIECVRAYPVIYDLNRKVCQERSAKDNAWRQIAAILDYDVTECQKRWRTIRDSYKKINKKKMIGMSVPAKSKYLSENLKFLDVCLQERSQFFSTPEDHDEESLSRSINGSLGEVSIHEEEQVQPSDEEDRKDLLEKELNISVSCEEYSSRQTLQSGSELNERSERKRRKVAIHREDIVVQMSEEREEQLLLHNYHLAGRNDPPEGDNPVFTFFRSMAQTVTRFPPSVIAETRVRVCQLIAEMESKALYEQN